MQPRVRRRMGSAISAKECGRLRRRGRGGSRRRPARGRLPRRSSPLLRLRGPMHALGLAPGAGQVLIVEPLAKVCRDGRHRDVQEPPTRLLPSIPQLVARALASGRRSWRVKCSNTSREDISPTPWLVDRLVMCSNLGRELLPGGVSDWFLRVGRLGHARPNLTRARHCNVEHVFRVWPANSPTSRNPSGEKLSKDARANSESVSTGQGGVERSGDHVFEHVFRGLRRLDPEACV